MKASIKKKKRYGKVIDSKKKKVYSTGAKRDVQDGKGRFDLIPGYALQRLADHYENGARKYSERNWEKGIPISRFVDSAFRHLNKWTQGYDEEDHLAAVAWNVFGLMWTQEMIRRKLLPGTLWAGMRYDLINTKKERK